MHADLISPGLRALIIEDEALIAEELRGRLSGLGFEIIGTVDTAEEGIEIATRERPDLVLMDIRLRGEKDGIEACREIREEVDVPILYLTAYSDNQTVERAKQTDHDGFLLKPFHRHELQSTIAVALQRHKLRTKRKPQ
ncbi:MAG TPA: response regulator [Terriglobales bacterium]